MARDPDKLAASFEVGNTGGFLSGFLAEEDVLDRSGLWRLGAWGVASVGAVVLAVYANQSSITLRRDQSAAVDLGRQAQQIQAVASESQNETRRLASAIDTLNGDRDRLYSRISALEQGLDSVTGAIAKQKAAVTAAIPVATLPTPAPAVATLEMSQPVSQSAAPGTALSPAVSPVATTAPKLAEKPGTAGPEPAAAVIASVAQKNSNAPAAASSAVIANTPVAAASAAIPAPPATPTAFGMSTSAPPASNTPAVPTAPVVTTKSMTTATEPAPAKSTEPDKPAKTITAAPLPEVVASVALDDKVVEGEGSEAAAPGLPVQRTEFGVDVGGANSVAGLRALWRGLLRSKSNAALTTLRPIIVIREGRNGLGMQLRLVAGPFDDAAAAAKICAGLIESERPCETTVFDGQRLAMNAEETAMAAKPAPTGGRQFVRRRTAPKRVAAEDPPKPDSLKPDPPSTLSTFFRR
jgi:hypothetical protein